MAHVRLRRSAPTTRVTARTTCSRPAPRVSSASSSCSNHLRSCSPGWAGATDQRDNEGASAPSLCVRAVCLGTEHAVRVWLIRLGIRPGPEKNLPRSIHRRAGLSVRQHGTPVSGTAHDASSALRNPPIEDTSRTRAEGGYSARKTHGAALAWFLNYSCQERDTNNL